jgi:prevent-host-death family protein
MASYNVHEAKSGLSRLLKETERGEEVIIMRNGEPVAKLVPYRRRRQKKIKLGFAAGLVKEIDPNWWKAMTDEEVDEMFGGKF